MWDDCCHSFVSEDSGQTWTEGCTPGNASTPAPNDPGLDPHGVGTLGDPWSDGCMAINDGDYVTFVGIDFTYNTISGTQHGLIGISTDRALNQTWTLIDPAPGEPGLNDSNSLGYQYVRGACSAAAETILVVPYASTSWGHPEQDDAYPRISRDGGDTWSDVTGTGIDPDVKWSHVCFGSEASQIMYMKPSGNGTNSINPAYLRKSSDWGATWSVLASGPDYQSVQDDGGQMRLRCSADGQTVIMMAYTGEFWISQDGGANWTSIDFTDFLDGQTGFQHGDCGISPDGQNIIVGMGQTLPDFNVGVAIFVSTDGGNNFTNVSANIQYPPSSNGAAHLGQCNISQDGQGLVFTFDYDEDSETVFPNGLTGKLLFANVSTDGGATFDLITLDADPYAVNSFLGFWTAAFIMNLEEPAVYVGGSGMQVDPLGCRVVAVPFALDVRDLNSVLELGPFRFVEQKDSDETSMITSLVLGLTEVDIGLVVEVDMATEPTSTIDMATLVDVLGDDIEVDMGEGTGNSDDFTLELLGNDDGSTYPGAPIEFKPEELEPIDDRGSTKQYSPTGYSYLYHRVRLKATEVDEKFAVKFVDISGQLTGRLF